MSVDRGKRVARLSGLSFVSGEDRDGPAVEVEVETVEVEKVARERSVGQGALCVACGGGAPIGGTPVQCNQQ